MRSGSAHGQHFIGRDLILGGIAAYPVARFLMGAAPAGLFIYVIPFLISTVAGSILAYVLIRLFQKSGIFSMIQSGN